MRQTPVILVAASTLVAALAVEHRALNGAAPDWPQFLGPARNGVYSGPPLAETWPAAGPRKVWQKSVGQGFAGPVVVGDRVILFHRVGNEEVVEALDARTGKAHWRYAYTTAYRDDFGFDEGPRAVPVVANGRVYTFGAEGQLHAIDVATGKRIWSVDTMRRFGVRKGFFGAAGSPLVEDGRVIANIGGTDGDEGRRHRRVQRRHGRGALDGDRSPGELFVTGRRHVRRKAPRRILHAWRPGGARSGDGSRPVSTAVAVAVGLFRQRRDAARRRRRDLRVGDVRDGRRRAAREREHSSPSSGRQTMCCRITTRRASTPTATCMAFTAARSSTRAFARWS